MRLSAPDKLVYSTHDYGPGVYHQNLSYTYSAWSPDSADTGGILSDDWSTLDQSKLAMLAPDQTNARRTSAY
jgi:hypothetical protein